MTAINHECGFCGKAVKQTINDAKDKIWKCKSCGFECCGECMTIHYQRAHIHEYLLYKEFPHLLESGKIIFFPHKRRNK